MLLDEFSILVTGLGGQGVLTLAKCIARAAFETYPFATRTESRGLSQRGGPVSSMVRFGMRPLAPYTGRCGSHALLSLDALESARNIPSLRQDGILVTSSHSIPPAHMLRSWALQPNGSDEQSKFNCAVEGILNTWRKKFILDVESVDAAEKTPRSMNFALLGAASCFIPLSSEIIQSCISKVISAAASKACVSAFNAGRRTALDHTQ